MGGEGRDGESYPLFVQALMKNIVYLRADGDAALAAWIPSDGEKGHTVVQLHDKDITVEAWFSPSEGIGRISP